MRFEIRAGGAFLILVGLVGLSGGVFALGLVAGYEMARRNQPDLNQISSTYPLPKSPAPDEKPAPVSEMSGAAVASPAVASAPPAEANKPPPEPALGEEAPAAPPSPATVARVKPPAEAPAASRPAPAAEDEDTDEDTETASAPPAPRRRRPRCRPALARTTFRSKP